MDCAGYGLGWGRYVIVLQGYKRGLVIREIDTHFLYITVSRIQAKSNKNEVFKPK